MLSWFLRFFTSPGMTTIGGGWFSLDSPHFGHRLAKGEEVNSNQSFGFYRAKTPSASECKSISPYVPSPHVRWCRAGN